MADVNRGDRPLSPHLQAYRLPLTAVMSIMHRITGVGLLVGSVLFVWWIFAAATGPEAFAVADGFLAGPIGGFLMLGSGLALIYHTLNGLRHLLWDMGYGFDLGTTAANNWIIIFATLGLTAGLWALAVFGGA